MNLKEAE